MKDMHLSWHLPLMLTCRLFYDLLHPSHKAHLYRRIFFRKFDSAAVSPLPTSSPRSLSRAQEALSRNAMHQTRRCTPSLVGQCPRRRVHHGLRARCPQSSPHRRHRPARVFRQVYSRASHRGRKVWPTEDACNVLAVTLFWHMISQGPCLDNSFFSFRRT